jgi:hypothetical protein
MILGGFQFRSQIKIIFFLAERKNISDSYSQIILLIPLTKGARDNFEYTYALIPVVGFETCMTCEISKNFIQPN